MRVLIQLRQSELLLVAATRGEPAPEVGAGVEAAVPGLSLDLAFPPVQVPAARSATDGQFSPSAPAAYSLRPDESTYVVRGQIPDGAPQRAALATAAAHPDVVGVFSDPVIESCRVWPGTPPGCQAHVVPGWQHGIEQHGPDVPAGSAELVARWRVRLEG